MTIFDIEAHDGCRSFNTLCETCKQDILEILKHETPADEKAVDEGIYQARVDMAFGPWDGAA